MLSLVKIGLRTLGIACSITTAIGVSIENVVPPLGEILSDGDIRNE